MRNILILTIALFTFFLGSQLYAATWEIDPAHTTVEFSVQHMMLTTVHGTFNTFTGSVNYDIKNPAGLTIEANIDAASVDTRNDRRDNHLKSADFFDVANSPKITFKSKQTEVVSPGHFKVTGDLTIRNVTKEVLLDVTGLTQTITEGKAGTRTAASATGSINREDFGLMWNKALESGGVLVGKQVQINIEAELVQKTGE
jgi:polyisoprenoid-binding protein YceI